MAGNPLFHQLSQTIEQRGGDDYVMDLIRDGWSANKVARELKVSRPLLYKWRNVSDERKKAWAAAMKDSAEARAEDAGEILDDLAGKPVTPAEVSLADKRASFRRWEAGILDPERYADRQAGTNVTFNIASLHLDALRQYGDMRLNPHRAEPTPALAAVTADEDGD